MLLHLCFFFVVVVVIKKFLSDDTVDHTPFFDDQGAV